MTLPYVYKLTDKVTVKWYIGSRTAKGCEPLELGVRYFSSSKLVGPLYTAEPGRFISEILVRSEDPEYVIRVEADILKFRNAKNDPESYNMRDSDGKFNPSKAAYLTVAMKVGVHNRTKEELITHARMGGLKGGKVTKARKVGIFNRSMEEMKATGRHVGLTQSLEIKIANGKKSGEYCKVNKLGIHSQTHEEHVAQGKRVSSMKRKCDICGLVSSPSNIFQHQRATGHTGVTNNDI